MLHALIITKKLLKVDNYIIKQNAIKTINLNSDSRIRTKQHWMHGVQNYGGNSVVYILCSEQVLGTGDC